MSFESDQPGLEYDPEMAGVKTSSGHADNNHFLRSPPSRTRALKTSPRSRRMKTKRSPQLPRRHSLKPRPHRTAASTNYTSRRLSQSNNPYPSADSNTNSYNNSTNNSPAIQKSFTWDIADASSSNAPGIKTNSNYNYNNDSDDDDYDDDGYVYSPDKYKIATPTDNVNSTPSNIVTFNHERPTRKILKKRHSMINEQSPTTPTRRAIRRASSYGYNHANDIASPGRTRDRDFEKGSRDRPRRDNNRDNNRDRDRDRDRDTRGGRTKGRRRMSAHVTSLRHNHRDRDSKSSNSNDGNDSRNNNRRPPHARNNIVPTQKVRFDLAKGGSPQKSSPNTQNRFVSSILKTSSQFGNHNGSGAKAGATHSNKHSISHKQIRSIDKERHRKRKEGSAASTDDVIIEMDNTRGMRGIKQYTYDNGDDGNETDEIVNDIPIRAIMVLVLILSIIAGTIFGVMFGIV